MFTTGSKLFLGATVLCLVATVAYGITRGGDVGWTASVGLLTATVALAFLTGVNFFTRDGNVSAAQQEAAPLAGAAQPAPGRSMWPAVAALGLGLLVVGLITEPVVFKAGIVVLIAVILEWMVQVWSERASADPVYNASLRKRLLHPLEFPVLAALGLGVVIYSFSRIMLFLSKTSGPVVFGVIALLVLLVGALFALRPDVKRGLVAGVCAIAGLGLVSTGAVMAVDGERDDLHRHEIIAEEPEVCRSNEETEVDEKSSQSIAAKSNVTAIVTFEDGRLRASVEGIDQPVESITIQRSAPSNIIFRNLDEEHVRLTANLGTFETDVNGTQVLEQPVTCTALVEEGGSQLLSLTLRTPSVASSTPYTLTVPEVEGTAIEIVVP